MVALSEWIAIERDEGGKAEYGNQITLSLGALSIHLEEDGLLLEEVGSFLIWE